jgi:hypothetical protein
MDGGKLKVTNVLDWSQLPSARLARISLCHWPSPRLACLILSCSEETDPTICPWVSSLGSEPTQFSQDLVRVFTERGDAAHMR